MADHRVWQHYVPSHSDLARSCSYYMQIMSRIRNHVIDVIIAHYRVYGDFRLTEESIRDLQLPERKNGKTWLSSDIWDMDILYHVLNDIPDFRCDENTKVLKQVFNNCSQEWKNWQAALMAYERDSRGFKGKPMPPLKKPLGGEYKAVWPKEAISFVRNAGYLSLSGSTIDIVNHLNLDKSSLCHVEITRGVEDYKISVVYKKNRGAKACFCRKNTVCHWKRSCFWWNRRLVFKPTRES